MKKSVVAIVIKSFALLVVFGTAGRAMAQDVATAYLKMVPIEQYLMGRDAEIALAHSTAPDSTSHDATVMIPAQLGYETPLEGKNGWAASSTAAGVACSTIPNSRALKFAAQFASIPLARSFLPYDYKRTELILAGHSKEEAIAATRAAIDKKELPVLEPGICYMMSKSSYLGDTGDQLN